MHPRDHKLVQGCCCLFWDTVAKFILEWMRKHMKITIHLNHCSGVFAKLRKATVIFVKSVRPSFRPSVRPSVHPSFRRLFCLSAWYNSPTTRWIFMKFDILLFFENFRYNTIGEINGYFTWRLIYIFDHISLISYQNKKCFRRKFLRKSKHTLYIH